MTAPAIKAALDAAAQSWCCGLAACHYNDCGLPCEARDHRRMAAAVAAFLRMIPTGMPTADSPCHMRFVDDAAREAWAAAVEQAAEGGADG